MRKKNAGALFMDFHVSPDDRVGAVPKKTRGKAGKPAPANKTSRSARNVRQEPRFGNIDSVYDETYRGDGDDERRQRGRRQKVKKTRGRRERKPLTFGRILWKLFSWLMVLGIWAGIAAGGVAVYFLMQMPASNTWAIPERPANIRIVAANGQLISNRGKTGGEAISLRELPYYVPAAFV
ncbi:MAG: hypothetical protein EOP19_01690, partial [Hyphomicrobiales bacterium]